MTTNPVSPAGGITAAPALPAVWQPELHAHLSTGENVITTLEVDLDARLQFSRGIVVLTDRRLLARAPGAAEWQAWTFSHRLTLNHHDHAGVGHLELTDGNGRLAAWRFTLGQNLQAIRLVELFAAHLDSHISWCARAARRRWSRTRTNARSAPK
jgi:ATP-binding cassette subfamily B protein